MKNFIYLLMLLPAVCLAQKIKIKKEQILFDDKPVAVIKDAGNRLYEFYSLDGTKQFTAQYNAISQDKVVTYQWLVVKSADGAKQSEVPYEVLITAFNTGRIILQLVHQRYGLVDANGINQAKLDEFFVANTEKLSDKYLKTVTIAKEDAKASQAEWAAKVGAVRPFVKKDGTIVAGGSLGTKIMGKVYPIQNYIALNSNNGPITVYDLDKVKVASAEISDNGNNDINVTMFNGTTFTYAAKRRYTNTENELFLTQFIEELVARDYTLGHQATQYNQATLNQKIALAKERSANIYGIKGYAIDDKGVKYKGTVTAQFQKLDVNETGNTEVVDAIDNYGKNVTVKYLNEKNRERVTTLKASDGTKFCVTNKDGSETCFIGMKVKGDALKKLSNAMSLGFNNAYFYELVYEANGNQVLRDPVEPDIYVIKLKSQKVGQMIDTRNNKSLSKELAEYLGTCKELSNEITTGVFDLKIQDNLIKIVDEYNSCK